MMGNLRKLDEEQLAELLQSYGCHEPSEAARAVIEFFRERFNARQAARLEGFIASLQEWA